MNKLIQQSNINSSGQNAARNEAQVLISQIKEQKGIIFTEYNDIQLKLFDVDSTLTPAEFDDLCSNLDPQSKIMLCEKVKLIYGFDSLTAFIIRLVNILNFSKFLSIFDITSNIKLYGFYSLNYLNPVEILVKQIRHDLFIVKSFKEFTIQEMKKEHDFHLPYKEFKRLNLNDGNLVVVKILFKNEQQPIDISIIKPLLPKIELLHLSLENESKLRPFNDLIDSYGTNLKYLKFGVNRGIFKNLPVKNSIDVMKLVNIDNLNFINDLKDCKSLDVFFDNWELRKNCDIKFQQDFIIGFEVSQLINNLKVLNIFHTYLDSKDLAKLKLFPNLTHSKISYVILENDGFDLSECLNLQELKIHFTYYKSEEEKDDPKPEDTIHWPPNLKKLSITIHNIKNLIQNFSIRLNILRKIAKPLPPSIIDLCIDISYDTGGSGPELYSISRDDILKISMLINQILTNNLENLKLKGISRYNYKIGKPLIFSAINFPSSLKLLSLNDFILDYNFINLPNLKKLYLEHSLFDSDFNLPPSEEILIEKCTFKDLTTLPSASSRIEFKMCTFRKVPSYKGDVSNVIINNCRVMEQPMNNTFQFQQQLQMHNGASGGPSTPNTAHHGGGMNSHGSSSSSSASNMSQNHRNGGQQSNFFQQQAVAAAQSQQLPPPRSLAPHMTRHQSHPDIFYSPQSNSPVVPPASNGKRDFPSSADMLGFLDKDLEFQLNNLSLNSSANTLTQNVNNYSPSPINTPFRSSFSNPTNNNVNTPSPTPTSALFNNFQNSSPHMNNAQNLNTSISQQPPPLSVFMNQFGGNHSTSSTNQSANSIPSTPTGSNYFLNSNGTGGTNIGTPQLNQQNHTGGGSKFMDPAASSSFFMGTSNSQPYQTQQQANHYSQQQANQYNQYSQQAPFSQPQPSYMGGQPMHHQSQPPMSAGSQSSLLGSMNGYGNNGNLGSPSSLNTPVMGSFNILRTGSQNGYLDGSNGNGYYSSGSTGNGPNSNPGSAQGNYFF